ncbi:MAG: hypothetical protein ABI650_02895, partial [Dokdonella sp.]
LQTLPIQVHGDSVAEADEGFTLTLVRNRIVNAAVGSGVPGNVVASGTIVTDDLSPGTRFILVGKDESGGSNRVRRYTTTGTFIDAWGPFESNTQGHVASGLCFSPQGNILSTRFAAPSPVYYSPAGAVLDGSFGVAPGYVGLQNEESCAFDLAGNVYMGQASVGGVKKFNRLGVVLDSFDVPIGPRGSDWIDLAGDQCTLYYTSEGTTVRRYNVCTHSARADFATGLTPPYCYALRRRPNGELMVACQEAVHRLSALGAHMQVYSRQSIGEIESHGLFALNLDPDGSSFWTAGVISGNVYRVDIASGAVLTSFNSGSGGVGGLAVYGQLGDDTIFVDGFDPPLALVPLVPTGPSTALYEESECAEEFWPKIENMPHYVPAWVSLVVRENGDCVEHE